MKKYLLFIISMLCVSIGAWADSTVDIKTSDGTTTISITGDGTGTVTFADGCENLPGTAVNTVVTGPLTQAVWTAISNNKGGWNTQASDGQIIDLKGVTGLTTSELLNVGMFSNINGTNNTNYIILPTGSDVPTAEQTANNTSPSFDNWDNLKYFIIPQTDGSCKVVLVDPINSINTEHLVLNNGSTTVDVVGITGDGQEPPTEQNIKSVIAQLETAGYKTPPVTISGCTVSINVNNAGSKDMTTLLSEAKSTVIAGGESGICTLIVNGTLSSTDLASLGDNSMTGATRIDLSGATLASGVSTDNIQIPSSLTSLILPKNTTVSSVLAGKLEAAGNVNYAYSPSTDPEEDDPTVADYVWVVKAGGLKTALTSETSLRTSKYIKVASDVELNEDDLNLSSANVGEMNNVKYLDMRFANMTVSNSTNYKSPSSQSYRLILPDGWTAEQMNTFATGPLNNVAWSMAAIYSYDGTTLNIHHLSNDKYMNTALANPRIVYSGTTAINVVNNTMGANLLAALNGATSSVTSITIAGSAIDDLTFTNPNITSLTLSNFDRSTADVIIAAGCSSLETLDLTGAKLDNVTASGRTALTMVRMNGTVINGNADLSGCSNLTTAGFLTNSSTEFKGTLNLASTGLTSFASPAKVTGNIYLNATQLTSLDLTTPQFQNTSSVIHIDAATDENGTTAISSLKRKGGTNNETAIKTISVPNGFDKDTRIHPYADVQDHVAEAAQSGGEAGGISGCEGNACKITYNDGVATVHTIHAGHFAELMKTNYTSYPQGTTFKFDKDCVLNLDDLKSLCGKNTDNDMNWRSNYYYVDLYDVPATSDLCATPTTGNGLIYQWITWMRENDRQVKGLILPKDHTQYGSGTTLIQDGAGTNTQLATCSEFIAYYKTKDEQGNSLTQQTFVGHVYNQSPTNADAYQASYEKMLSLVDAHTYTSGEDEVPEVKTNADIVLITSNSATKLNSSSTSISGSTRIETINNEMVGTQTGKGSIYAYPNAPGAFATACASTNLKSTPTELLQINGTLTNDDIDAINGFTDGPRVLDLRYATSAGQTGMITKAMLEALTNTHIEYILLPEGQTKAVVCGSNYSDLTSLKAVISSTSTNCVAYVKEAGSLAEARYLATGGSIVQGTSLFSPTKLGLTSVTLAGTLNAADLGCNLTTYGITDDGHWSDTSTAANASVGLSQESGITSIDLKDAVFVNKVEETTAGVTSFADMNFSWAGLANLSNIQLPTNGEMKLIPQNCCGGLASLKEICIPNNYTKIDNGAFLNTIVEHITTTDAHGALIDNGPNSYTLSANLQEIGSDPGAGNALAECVFPQNRPVYNCYILATKTPKCYKNAFPANMLYGWGGFDGTLPYCRDKYVNGTNYFCVLRFPSEQSYDAVTNSDKKDVSYELMQKQYTDVTKVYSKKEQTGAVDANGKEITWPTFSELRRAYNQATASITWNRWVATYDSNEEVNGGESIPTEAEGLTLGHYKYDATNSPGNNDLGDYEFTGYEGWHQFTLSQATYVEPDEVIEQEKIVREYEDAGWFTFCIPYDMTIKQVREWLGVPKSEGNVISKYDGSEVPTDMMPEAHQLYTVVRHTSTGPGDNNSVTLRFTTDLINSDGTGDYLTFNVSAEKDEISRTAVANNESYDNETRPVLKGGIPYLIKAYKRKGVTIKSRNLGDYIMKAHADEWKQERSCLRHGLKYREYLGKSADTEETPLGTLHFAKPFEHHKIWAADDASTANYLKHKDGKKYYYAFVGQFWDQKLPKYCFYQGGQNWYRNTSDNNYVWQAYKCVIMAIPVNDNDTHVSSGKYRDETNSNYPNIETGTADKLDGTLKIAFSNGLDDNDFPGIGGAPKYIFTDMVTETILEYEDEKGNITSIDNLDGVDTTPKYKKIYNMSGQYMGTSTENLPKGMYIINGKKFVVQ